jgi:hypothetical protein
MATKVISTKELYKNPKYAKHIRAYEKAQRKKESFNGVQDDDYDNFFTREYWDRRKKRRTLRKQYKSEGMNRREARQKARREAREEVPRVPLKEAVKRGWNTFKKVQLAIPRNAGLTLIALNYRGVAQKLGFGYQKPEYKKKIEDKWITLGGNPDKLAQAVVSGQKKNPIICGVKCKKALVDYKIEEKKSFTGGVKDFDYSYPSGLEEVGILVGIGGTIVGSITGVVSTIKNDNRQKEMLEEQERVNSEMLKQQSDQQTFEQEAYMRQEKANNDPIKEIQADPELSPQEKAQAIAVINEALDPDNMGVFGQTEKFNPLMALGIVAGIILVVGVAKRLSGNNAPVGA